MGWGSFQGEIGTQIHFELLIKENLLKVNKNQALFKIIKNSYFNFQPLFFHFCKSFQ